MAFEGLTEKLSSVFKKLKSRGKLTESDIKIAMREIKLALLEADVNYKVVKSFIANVTEKSVGSLVLESLTPGQQVIKIVRDELITLMGSEVSASKTSSKPPTVYMLIGLQGAGKTTSCAKIAYNLKKSNNKILLVPCDVYRPAAIKQLKVLGEQIGVDVFDSDSNNPVKIADDACSFAKLKGYDIVIIDTAGRLHIDEDLVEELENIKNKVNPTEIYLTVDAMTGQDAVNVAEAFNEKPGIDAVILTKLDGDAKGGAALSIKAVTQKPIKFCGMGEKIDSLETFYPDRMASRILGMGDVLSLIDKAQEAFDEKKALELEKKLRSQQFDLNDFLDQLGQMKNMGSISQLIDMIPGLNKKALQGVDIDEKGFSKTEAIILSMTKEERTNPSIIDYSRRKRIAAGSGTNLTMVNNLLKQFEQTKKMMKQFSNPKKMGMFKGMKLPF